MNKFVFFFISFFCLILFSNANGQKVELLYDTIHIISIRKIDSSTNSIIASAKYFYINKEYYLAENFPFMCLKCQASVSQKNKLYYLDYWSVIKQKSVQKIFSLQKKAKYFQVNTIKQSITRNSFSSGAINLIACLKSFEIGNFIISEQKILAAYFLVDCVLQKGTSDAIFCEDQTNTTQVPVVLNVLEVIK